MRTFLKQLLGRIKNNMSTIFITIAGFCFPSALGLFIFYMEDNNLSRFDQIGMIIVILGLFIISITAWASAIRTERIERHKEDLKYIDEIKHLEALRQDTIASMNIIGSNIKDLIIEIRKDRDERNKPDTKPQTPNSNITK
jgi:hypothetical protein